MTPVRRRCAIYTRKSSEEGLEQSFNSLDAQHEACVAYIASQRHEGWREIPSRYDDGGVSGGTLERPGLTRLLSDIDQGKVDLVVVYKIDRLTRSLSDFSRLVDQFEARSCAFVSVTQGFDTASSMGRLTLNVLLSFAQFEREVTAERIRDKLAASKRHGLWMGGLAPLGYDRHPDPAQQTLVINPSEAHIIKRLFDLYLETASLTEVTRLAAKAGYRSKAREFTSGRRQGNLPMRRGHIQSILTNPIYVGRIRHKDKVFEGRHPPIVSQETWDQVASRLGQARTHRGSGSTCWMKGKLRDDTGDRLTPTHTRKGKRRFSYYVSNRLIEGKPDRTGWRLPAAEVHAHVSRAVLDHIQAGKTNLRVLANPDAAGAANLSTRLGDLVIELRSDLGHRPADLVQEGMIAPGQMILHLDRAALAAILGMPRDALCPDWLEIRAPFTLRRRGAETRIVTGELVPQPDRKLQATLARARRWSEAISTGTSLGKLAQREHVSQSYMRSRMGLAFLSPRLQKAIMDGTQPLDLTVEKIVRAPIPLDWTEQERYYGLSPVPPVLA
jgi:site-specific DNA recombinase